MAVSLHGYLDTNALELYSNIKVGVLIIPIKLSIANKEVTVRYSGKDRVLSLNKDKNKHGYNLDFLDVIRAVKVKTTEVTIAVFDNYPEPILRLLNALATIMIIELNDNTHLQFMGKKSLNMAFFNGPRSCMGDIKITLKLHIASIISLMFKILMRR